MAFSNLQCSNGVFICFDLMCGLMGDVLHVGGLCQHMQGCQCTSLLDGLCCTQSCAAQGQHQEAFNYSPVVAAGAALLQAAATQ
jgi:hypothetical protein